jgi:hypothetical protein
MQNSTNVNRFLNRYEKLISAYTAIQDKIEVYEKHHITPLCLGGSNDSSNLIKLPPRAHYIAHYFLCKAYPSNRKLKHAFAMMFVNNPYQSRAFNSRMYELAKIERSKALKGVPRTEEVKQKLRKPKSTTSNYRKPKSEEHRLNIALGSRGRKHKTDTCVHCGKTCSVFNLSRWHNDNCKLISASFSTS